MGRMANQSTPPTMRWHVLRKAQGRGDALVVVLARHGDLGFARRLARHWGEAVPHAHFVTARSEFQSGRDFPSEFDRALWNEARRLGLQPSQIILVGHGEAAHFAFERVLHGGLAGLGAILVDMPAVPVPPGVPAMGAVLRFLRHDVPDAPHDRAFDLMVHALRQSAFDLRSMALPAGGDPAGRALGSFLIELVAKASGYRSLSSPPSFESKP